jgi:uncharacterized Tic20 family protein
MQAQPATLERNWAMAAHLSALVAVAGLPFGHVIGPLVVYLIKGHESEFVGEHARASLNYQITISIVSVVALIVVVAAWFGFIFNAATQGDHHGARLGLGFLSFWFTIAAGALLILLGSIVFIIMGTIAASEGRPYTYPFAIRFLR